MSATLRYMLWGLLVIVTAGTYLTSSSMSWSKNHLKHSKSSATNSSCTSTDLAGHCLQCEIPIPPGDSKVGNVQVFTCSNMPPGNEVTAKAYFDTTIVQNTFQGDVGITVIMDLKFIGPIQTCTYAGDRNLGFYWTSDDERVPSDGNAPFDYAVDEGAINILPNGIPGTVHIGANSNVTISAWPSIFRTPSNCSQAPKRR